MSNNEIILSSRFNIVEKSYANGSSEDGFRTEYTYSDALEINRNAADDVCKYNGEVCALGRFIGYPDNNEELVHFNTGLFYQGRKIVDGSANMFSVPDIYVTAGTIVKKDYSSGAVSIYDMQGKKQGSVAADKFLGFNEENHLLAVQNGKEVEAFEYNTNGLRQYEAAQFRLLDFSYSSKKLTSINGAIEYENGNKKIVQTPVYKDETIVNSCIVDENGRGRVYYHSENGDKDLSFDKIENNAIDMIVKHPELFERKVIEGLYAAQVAAANSANVKNIRQVYQNLYNENIDNIKDEEGHTLYQKYAAKILDENSAKVLRECFYEQYLNDTNVPIYNGWNADTGRMLNADFRAKSVAAQKQVNLYEHYVDQHPEMMEKYFDRDFKSYYLLRHPEKFSQMSLPRIKRSKNGDYSYRDRPDIEFIKKANPLFLEKGINILGLEDFALAKDEQQSAALKQQGFKISNAEEAAYAFMALAQSFGSKDAAESAQAQTLLLRLFDGHSQYLDLSDIANKNRNEQADIANASGMLWAAGKINESNDYMRTYGRYIKDYASPKVVKQLYAKGMLQINVTDYTKSSFDEFCPVNEKFVEFGGNSKTNLLDYFLRQEKSDRVVWLLNHGADVNSDVERYSNKQGRNFPIKPFARFIDNKIFLRKTGALEKMMTEIAKGLDADKGHLIDKIFASLPYKTKEDVVVKKLQQKMKEEFAKTQSPQQQNSSETTQNYYSKKDEQEKASRSFYKEHLKEFEALDKRYQACEGTGEEYKFKFAESTSYKSLKGYSDEYYNAEALEKIKKDIAAKEQQRDTQRGGNSTAEIKKVFFEELRAKKTADDTSLYEQLIAQNCIILCNDDKITIKDSEGKKEYFQGTYSEQLIPEVESVLKVKSSENEKMECQQLEAAKKIKAYKNFDIAVKEEYRNFCENDSGSQGMSYFHRGSKLLEKTIDAESKIDYCETSQYEDNAPSPTITEHKNTEAQKTVLEEVEISQFSAEENRRLLKEAKQKLKAAQESANEAPPQALDLSALSNAFGGLGSISGGKKGGRK